MDAERAVELLKKELETWHEGSEFYEAMCCAIDAMEWKPIESAPKDGSSPRSPGCSKAEQIMTAVIQYGDAREIARQAEIDGGIAKRAEVAELLAEKYRQVARLVGL